MYHKFFSLFLQNIPLRTEPRKPGGNEKGQLVVCADVELLGKNIITIQQHNSNTMTPYILARSWSRHKHRVNKVHLHVSST
jgi:hypothetical protein